MIEFVQVAGSRYPREEVAEAVALLQWLKAENFVFLGYREYVFDGDGDDATVRAASGSGLGILSDLSSSAYAEPVPVADIKPALRERVLGGPLVIVSKTNREATVHRRVKMDYVGVKRVDEARPHRRRAAAAGPVHQQGPDGAGPRDPGDAPEARRDRAVGGSYPRIARLQGRGHHLRVLPQG